MTNVLSNLISIPGVEDGKLAGKTVWGAFSGDINLDALEREWAAEGLAPELLPNRPTAEKALRKALTEVKRGARELIRPLGKDAKTGDRIKGYSLIDEKADGEVLAHTQGIVATVGWNTDDPDNAYQVAVVTPADDPRAQQIRDLFDEYRNRLTARDQIGPWIFTKLAIGHCDAIGLRATGGVYFIPPKRLAEFEKFCEVLRRVGSSKVVGIPTVECEDAVEAVLEGVKTAAAKLIEDTERDLAKTGDAALGESALETRKKRAQAMRDKLGRYESLLGTALPDIHEKLESLNADIAGAVLLAGGTDDDDFV